MLLYCSLLNHLQIKFFMKISSIKDICFYTANSLTRIIHRNNLKLNLTSPKLTHYKL